MKVNYSVNIVSHTTPLTFSEHETLEGAKIAFVDALLSLPEYSVIEKEALSDQDTIQGVMFRAEITSLTDQWVVVLQKIG